jgi:Sulfotransferase domain
MTLAVIGPGFGRTGTVSLRDAWQRLRLGRCDHRHEGGRNPGQAHGSERAADGAAVDRDELR